MASLAKPESRRLSQNVRLDIQYRYQQGKVQVCTNCFLGYDKVENSNLVINPTGEEVGKEIFREYLEGKSEYAIGQELMVDDIKTAAGSDYWLASAFKKILQKSNIFDLRQRHSCADREKPLEASVPSWHI